MSIHRTPIIPNGNFLLPETRLHESVYNAYITGLVPLKHKSHSNSKMRYHNVALVEAIHWAVEQINNNPEILPNFTVGYEIRDTMSDPAYSSVQVMVFNIFIM